MPKYLLGAKKRVSTGFSCDPDVLDSAHKKLLKGQSFSAILETLLAGWVKGEYVILPAQPQAPVTP